MYILKKKCQVYFRDRYDPNDIIYCEGIGDTESLALSKAKSDCQTKVGPSVDDRDIHERKCEMIAQENGRERVTYLDVYVPDDPNTPIRLEGQSQCNRIRSNVHGWASKRYLFANGDPFISGHGPVEWFGDDIIIVLFSKAVLLNVASSDIGAGNPAGSNRISPIFHYCQRQGYLGGYGPVEWFGGHEIIVAFTAEYADEPFHVSDNELAARGGGGKGVSSAQTGSRKRLLNWIRCRLGARR
jgi:hypothetical protein